MTLNAVSQNLPKDSLTCIPNSQLRTALRLVERGNFAEQQLANANTSISILEARIKNKDEIIGKHEVNAVHFNELVANAESRVRNAEKKSELDREWVNSLNNKLRKQKRKTTFAWIIGGVATAGSIFLFGH